MREERLKRRFVSDIIVRDGHNARSRRNYVSERKDGGMKKKTAPVTLHYMMLTGGFWMAFCIVTSYAAVYLQAAGYSNSELGLIMASGSLGGAVLSPALGAWIDRKRTVRHATVIYILLAVQTILLILLRVNPRRNLPGAVCYALYMAFLLPVNAVNLDLCVRLEHAGAPLDFGFARSMGSFSFVIISAVLGSLVEKLTYLVLPFAGLVIIVLQFLGTRLTDADLREAEKTAEAAGEENAGSSSSLPAFFRENRPFCVMLIATVLIFIAHNAEGNFLINVVRNLGGDTKIMGYLAAFIAIIEVPVMLFSDRLPRRFSCSQYIRLALALFVLKVLSCALAPNIPLLFASRLLQAPSYALYTILIVPFADAAVPHKDSAKAQSLAFSMTTVGSVIASLAGGRLFDICSVRATMLIMTAIAAVGAAVAIGAAFRCGNVELPERRNGDQ